MSGLLKWCRKWRQGRQLLEETNAREERLVKETNARQECEEGQLLEDTKTRLERAELRETEAKARLKRIIKETMACQERVEPRETKAREAEMQILPEEKDHEQAQALLLSLWMVYFSLEDTKVLQERLVKEAKTCQERVELRETKVREAEMQILHEEKDPQQVQALLVSMWTVYYSLEESKAREERQLLWETEARLEREKRKERELLRETKAREERKERQLLWETKAREAEMQFLRKRKDRQQALALRGTLHELHRTMDPLIAAQAYNNRFCPLTRLPEEILLEGWKWILALEKEERKERRKGLLGGLQGIEVGLDGGDGGTCVVPYPPSDQQLYAD